WCSVSTSSANRDGRAGGGCWRLHLSIAVDILAAAAHLALGRPLASGPKVPQRLGRLKRPGREIRLCRAVVPADKHDDVELRRSRETPYALAADAASCHVRWLPVESCRCGPKRGSPGD